MNKQLYDILDYLVKNQNKQLLISQIAGHFSVTERTVRNYLKQIETILQENDIAAVLQRKQGMLVFSIDDECMKKLQEVMESIDYFNYKLSFEERRLIISLILLTSDSFVTLDTIAELLYVSKSTAYKDMASLIEMLDHAGVKVSEKKVKGYFLDIDESKRRELILNSIESEYDYSSNPFDENDKSLRGRILSHYLELEKYYNAVEAALYVVEQHYDLSFSERRFRDLVYSICIVFSRAYYEHYVDESDICDDRDSIEIARRIVELSYNKTLPDSEIKYMAEKINQSKEEKCDLVLEQKDINYYFVVKSFLFKLSKEYKINLAQDYKLQEFLTQHIYAIHNRLENNEDLINPYKNELLSKYSNEYNTIVNNIYIIEKILQCKLTDDEISFILMHVIAAIERIRNEEYRYDVVLICDSGMGTSAFLEERLKKHYSFNIVDVCSSHHFKSSFYKKDYEDKKIDLVISTVSLHGVPTNWIRVTPMLNDDDLVKINEAIEELDFYREADKVDSITIKENNHSASEQLVYSDLKKYLTTDNIRLDIHADNWMQAIYRSGQPLIEAGIINEEYIQSIVDNVIQNGPYFVLVPGIAIAHSGASRGVNSFGVSFARLDKGVTFGSTDNDPVRIVIVLSILDSMSIKDLLFNFMNVLCDRNNYNRFISAADPQQIIQIFTEQEE